MNSTCDFLNCIFTNTSLGYRLLYRLDLTNLRHTYYLVTPNESMVATIDEVPNYNLQVNSIMNVTPNELCNAFYLTMNMLSYLSNNHVKKFHGWEPFASICRYWGCDFDEQGWIEKKIFLFPEISNISKRFHEWINKESSEYH